LKSKPQWPGIYTIFFRKGIKSMIPRLVILAAKTSSSLQLHLVNKIRLLAAGF
jgi:hypothetical protein